MKRFERLRIKLNKELNLKIPEHAVFKRTYAGIWQLSEGAWKWLCNYPEYPYDIGSSYTAGEILKAKKISVVYYEYCAGTTIEVDDETRPNQSPTIHSQISS